MLFNPFEQFEIIILYVVGLYPSLGLDLSLSNIQMYIVFVAAFLIFSFETISKSFTLIPNNWQKLLEVFYTFNFSIVSEQVGRRGYKFFPHI